MKNKFYLVTLAVLILDHLSKWLISSVLDRRLPMDLIPGYLRISYVENSGVAFGFFSGIQSAWKPYILAAMAVVAVVVILVYSSRMPLNRTLLQIALTLTMGGILGNFLDRVVHGYVVDFIDFHVRDAFYWPTFNLADSAITIGIALLLVDTVKNPETEEEFPTPLTGEK